MTVSSLLLLTCPLPSTQLDLSETHLTVEYSVESPLESEFVHLSHQAPHADAPPASRLLLWREKPEGMREGCRGG